MNLQRSALMHSGAWVFLFLFTATCTLFFFFSIVPASLWWLPVVAFVAFEYGVLHWLDYHKHGAANSDQWYCSLMMIVASVGAVTTATGLELIRWFTEAGLVHLDLWWTVYGVWAVIAIFPLNLIALVFCSLRSPSHLARYQMLSAVAKEGPATLMQPERVVSEDTGEIVAINPDYERLKNLEAAAIAKLGSREKLENMLGITSTSASNGHGKAPKKA